MENRGEIRFTAAIEAGRAILNAATKDEIVDRLRDAVRQLVHGDCQVVVDDPPTRSPGPQVRSHGPINVSDERLLGYLVTVAGVAWEGASGGSLHRLEEQLCEASALVAVGATAARISHLLNNAVGIILGHVQLLQRREPVVPAAQALAAMERQARRCAELSAQLSQLAQSVSADRQRVTPAQLLQRVLRTASDQARRQGVGLVFEAPPAEPPLMVPVLQPRLEGALSRLASNAIEASPRGATVTLRAVLECQEGRDGALLTVADQGAGIDPEHLRHLFEPFFTTKASGRGAGLGLFLARQVVELHGGTLRVESKPGAGTQAKVWLPA